ncbi:hypothetical protein MYAER_4027 [Microcystis aeruginosa NIES-2549]|uniref:Uncharacterized protein n=1 Tax=Microcystis aeruginosa NIES-2549 TaxID=1641812 RepID=A0A0F6RNQ3_MICAE|nr:hypothetical protein MYAER_4027 [Microcystis aeruginosa NIES-2549]AOC54760.1 hypothetical protein amyaer_4073 [Microcystis aeruginosa NIES-2481]
MQILFFPNVFPHTFPSISPLNLKFSTVYPDFSTGNSDRIGTCFEKKLILIVKIPIDRY